MGKFPKCLTELSVHDTIMAGYYSLTFLFLFFFSDFLNKGICGSHLNCIDKSTQFKWVISMETTALNHI